MATGKGTSRRLAVAALALAAAALGADPKPWGAFTQFNDRRVHFHCEGQARAGSPTVVLLHGTPRFSFHFALIQPAIAAFTRVCTYDRAGDAWSEPIPNQPTAQMFIDELDQFIDRMSPGAPVVLVGHSVGGVLARAYLAQHAAKVRALVLIDTASVPADRPSDDALREMANRGSQPQPDPTLDGPFEKLPRRFRESHLWATRKWNAYAASVDTFQALQYQADLYHIASTAKRDGMPVWIVGRAEPNAWAEAQRRLAADWPNAKLSLVANSSHDIELDQPASVVDAVRQAVVAAR
jgi:pimeloyl-ACP methyl ester carboxylesterase